MIHIIHDDKAYNCVQRTEGCARVVMNGRLAAYPPPAPLAPSADRRDDHRYEPVLLIRSAVVGGCGSFLCFIAIRICAQNSRQMKNASNTKQGIRTRRWHKSNMDGAAAVKRRAAAVTARSATIQIWHSRMSSGRGKPPPRVLKSMRKPIWILSADIFAEENFGNPSKCGLKVGQNIGMKTCKVRTVSAVFRASNLRIFPKSRAAPTTTCSLKSNAIAICIRIKNNQ